MISDELLDLLNNTRIGRGIRLPLLEIKQAELQSELKEDDLNINGKYINVCSCEHISYIDFNNFEEIRIENCDISKIKFNNCKKIELKYVRLDNESIDYINSLTNNIMLIGCIYDEKSEFNNNVIIINNEDYLGGLK